MHILNACVDSSTDLYCTALPGSPEVWEHTMLVELSAACSQGTTAAQALRLSTHPGVVGISAGLGYSCSTTQGVDTPVLHAPATVVGANSI